jgi:NTE family protein
VTTTGPVENTTDPAPPSARRVADFGESKRRKIAPGLQGGGAHGAFTWGVLDRRLEDPLNFRPLRKFPERIDFQV